MEELTQQMAIFLGELIDKGFELPITFASIARNGSVIVGRYTYKENGDGLDCEVIAEQISPPGFALPINTMYVDQDGKAAKSEIVQDKKPRLHLV